MNNEKFNIFSVPLGLLDYINPIFYSITIITIINNINSLLVKPFNIIFYIGAVLSIFFGFIIPTGKVMVGLGLIKFKMPVSLVFLVNLGILISGITILKYVFNMNIVLVLIILLLIIVTLYLIYRKNKKINTIAVLTGFFGYSTLYISLITLSIQKNNYIPTICYIIAIMLFVILCKIGIKDNLKNPKIHWKIEILNVICQGLVTLGTLLLFR